MSRKTKHDGHREQRDERTILPPEKLRFIHRSVPRSLCVLCVSAVNACFVSRYCLKK